MKLFLNLKENIKKCNIESVIVTLVLLITIVAGASYLLFAPKQDFSEDENRVLESAPKVTMTSLTDGSFMDSIESYVGDHFMLRKEFIALNTRVQLMIGKRDLGSNYSQTPAEGGVYFGNDDHIYEVLLPNRTDIFARNVAAMQLFAKKTSLPFYFMPVPSGAQEQQDRLPFSAPSHDQHEELNAIKANAGTNTKVIDLFDVLSDRTGYDYYYKTDHHWNTFGAYKGYEVLAEAMNIQATPQTDFDFKEVSNSFLGTLYSKAILSTQTPDILYLPIYKQQITVTQQTGKQQQNSLFWEEYLEKKDKYSVFLGGNHSVDVVRNSSAANGRKLLIMKDSYANSMVPFLATNFSEIHIIDLRFYNQDIYDYIQQNGITDTAAIYSIKQLCDVSVANKLSAR
nr:DHHW family protein [uncultured Caproiciproducens sp.]